MPEPKIYSAQQQAAIECPVPPLKGTRKSAQQYVDKITGSPWWRSHPDLPPRIWVREDPDENQGGLAFVNTDEQHVYKYRGVTKSLPFMILGHGLAVQDTKAIRDPWVILHELAHFMVPDSDASKDGHHGPIFVAKYILLVRRWLGREAADALVAACKEIKVRLNYGVIEHLISR